MKKLITIILIILITTVAYAATKITELTENASPAGEDITVCVDDPSGTPVTKKCSLTNIMANVPATDMSCTDCINATEIEDIYVLNSGDTLTGSYDLGGADSVEIPNGTAPTVNATGEIAVDTNLPSANQGSIIFYDGTQQINVVGTTDTPGDNEIPKYDAGTGTITWEADAGAAGGDSVSIDGVGVTDPDFVSTGDIDFVDTSNTVTANINAGSIVNADINASAAIAFSKMEAGSAGDILMSNGSTVEFLNLGTKGQQLTVNEGETALTYGLASKYLPARKASVGTITSGSPVYIASYNVAGYIEVEASDADNASTMPAIGLAYDDLTNSSTDRVLLMGNFSNIDTSSFSVGDAVYVSTTAGVLTNTKPTGANDLVQKVGIVGRSHASNGQLVVSGAGRSNDIPNSLSVNGTFVVGNNTVDFSDTTDNYVLTFDSASDTWAGAASSGSGAFSDSADPVVLNTTTKDVNIGTTHNNTAKLSVDGDADQVQLSVQGNATQTADIFVIEKSDGTEILTFDNAGLLTVTSLATTGTGQSSIAEMAVTGTFYLGGTDSTSEVVFTNSDQALTVNGQLEISASGTGTNYCNDANAQGCWGMEDATTETDLTTNGENLTVSSGDTIPQSATKQYGTYSRDFESSEADYLEATVDGGSTDINGANQNISMCAFIRLESVGANQNIVSKYDAGTSDRSFAFYVNSSNQLTFRLSNDGTATTTATSSSVLSASTWYHVCGVYNDTDIRTYINGSLDGTPAAHTTGLHNSSANFSIGAQFSSGTATATFDGLIDDVIILDRELSAVEVGSINSAGMQGTGGGIGQFTAADTTPDVSGSSRWLTGASVVTITDFDGATIGDGQLLFIESSGTVTFDCTASGLKCGSTDLTTNDGDFITWIYNGIDWLLMSFTDQSDNYN